MTLKDVFDLFKQRLEIEYFKRGVFNHLQLSPRMIAYFLSQAQQEIQRRLNIVQSYQIINLVDGTNTYSLPTKFGTFKAAMINNCNVKYESFDEIIKQPYRKALPTLCNVFYDEEGEKKLIVYPTPNANAVMYVYYYVDPNMFKASLLDFTGAGEPIAT